MSTLEIILLIMLWIIYGVYAAGRTDFHDALDMKPNEGTFLFICIAPLVFVIRAIQGIFRDYSK